MAAQPDEVRQVWFSRNQEAELRSTARWVVNVGGKGSGKTALVAWLIALHGGALPGLESYVGHATGANRQLLGGLFANDYKQLSTAILPEVFWWFDLLAIEYVYGKQPPDAWLERWHKEGLRVQSFPAKAYGSMLVLANGHHVFCSQLYQQHFTRLKSFQFGYAIVEEASEAEAEAVQMVAERTRVGECSQLYLHSNPPEVDSHWLFEWRDKMRAAAAEGSVALCEIRSRTWDNEENLRAGYVDELRAMLTPELVLARIEGEWVMVSSGRAYTGWDDTASLDVEARYQPDVPLIFGFDFNWTPAVAGVYQQCQNGLRKLEEVELAGGTSPVCEELIRRYPPVDHKAPVWISWDATGGRHASSSPSTDHQIIRDTIGRAYRPVLFRGPKANPHQRDRVNTVNAALCNSLGRRWYRVHPRCQHTIRDYRRVSWVPGHPHLDESDLELTHHTSADGYVVCCLRPMIKTVGLAAVRAA